MTETRSERRARERLERKAATKARLAAPPVPPVVPVALPWSRRSGAWRSNVLRRQIEAEHRAMSLLVSGNADDLAGSLVAAGAMAAWATRFFRRGRP